MDAFCHFECLIAREFRRFFDASEGKLGPGICMRAEVSPFPDEQAAIGGHDCISHLARQILQLGGESPVSVPWFIQ